ncbi:hypothetical protein H0H87_009827 [Tephrocybe sp. NHM501043]|nr:hypothetical protein H0H87_009827 [Tephrocybe sp. NHM501043]
MSLPFQRVVLANSLALRGGVSVVRDILAKNTPAAGFTTDEIYKLAIQQPPPPDYYNPHTEAGSRFPPIPTPKMKGKAKIPSPVPPNPEHPVRSKAFLKRSILPFLEGTQELQKARIERIVDKAEIFRIDKKGRKMPKYLGTQGEGTSMEKVWVWMPTATSSSKTQPPPQSMTEPPKPFGSEVGVGEDLSHLSKRRQRMRKRDILREAHMMKVMEGIKRQRERSAAGAELRRLQAERKAKME